MRLRTYKRKPKPIETLTWRDRVLDLRRTTGWPQAKFARISGICSFTVKRIERCTNRRYFPLLSTIRKIRYMEHVFDLELEQYRSNPDYYNRLPMQIMIRRFAAYDGDRYHYVRQKHVRPQFPPLQHPRRLEDIAALGGMEAFRDPVGAAHAHPNFIAARDKACEEQRIRRIQLTLARRAAYEAARGGFTEIVESRSQYQSDQEVGFGQSVA